LPNQLTNSAPESDETVSSKLLLVEAAVDVAGFCAEDAAAAPLARILPKAIEPVDCSILFVNRSMTKLATTPGLDDSLLIVSAMAEDIDGTVVADEDIVEDAECT